jgi:hypothetical protein
MSNSHSNKEQDQRIELTPTQSNPGAALASDFKVHRTFEKDLDIPFDGSKGDTLAEHRRLMGEREGFEPLPDRNEAPVIRYPHKS